MIKHFRLRMSLALSCLAILIIVIFACRRNYPTERKPSGTIEKFFDLPHDVDSTVAAIAASMKRQNEKRQLAQKLINKAGIPVWNKARVSKNPAEGKQLFIPFILENTKQTRAILIVKIKNRDTLYHLTIIQTQSTILLKQLNPVKPGKQKISFMLSCTSTMQFLATLNLQSTMDVL